MVTRHHGHIDTTVFVGQPPIVDATTQGGRLHHLDHRRHWHPLEVDSGEAVVFTGRKLTPR